MIPGLSGSLLSHEAVAKGIPAADSAERERARRQLRAWHLPLRAQLGPATPLRVIFDRFAEPLLRALGYHVMPINAIGTRLSGVLEAGGRASATLLLTTWGQDPAAAWQEAVRLGIGTSERWCFCLTGPSLRIVDAQRTYSRRFFEFDLELTMDNERTFAAFWGLLRADAMRSAPGGPPLLDRAVEFSERHRAAVRSALQQGVHEALGHLLDAFSAAMRRRSARRSATARDGVAPFDESLIVIYRILFLLFAEARGLVPRWHPIFRDSYTIEALRDPVEVLPRPPGVWEALQAIARLAHRGCRIGSLRVPPFNGRLFSPAHAPLADSVPLDDRVVRRAVLALTTRRQADGLERVAYGDLDVEQLGGVYERLLDFDPETRAKNMARVHSDHRKATGAFYTPRPLTEYLVRRALGPLVHDAAPEAILSLRILDPAMGSGAFLVAACRFMANAYEAALVREGGLTSEDITDAERAGFRRTVAQRCLYGVDINPMAVQLGRLSLWLATLSADRPLTFLDHRLRAGNSLVGAGLSDLARQAPGGGRSRLAALPLFADAAFESSLGAAIAVRIRIALDPGDTLDQVRAKERALAALHDERETIERWKSVCDLWCATWFTARPSGRRAVRFAALADALLDRGGLPLHIAGPHLQQAKDIAQRERFFHWTLEFPEIFGDTKGQPLAAPGFDAIVGNPPWEMLRGDRGGLSARNSARAAASSLTDFARGSGTYRWLGDGHINLYQLFLERSLALLRPGGRLAMVVPSGLATDRGTAALRRTLLDRTRIDSFVGVDNRHGIFPVHRSLRFLLVSAVAGGHTSTLPCRFGVGTADALDRLPDASPDEDAIPLMRALLERVSGEQLAVPDIRSRHDVDILNSITSRLAALGDAAGWNVHFGRELNATDDRGHFTVEPDGLPVVEGKHLYPFGVDAGAAGARISPAVAARLLDRRRTFGRPRLAYREVASATNRLTLIAAIIPIDVVTTHTIFCVKEALDEDSQRYLCAVLNSFVANYLIRMRVSTHVSAGIIDRLRAPLPQRHSARFREIVDLSATLEEAGSSGRNGGGSQNSARLQALVAIQYGVTTAQLQHIVSTLPLLPQRDRDAALSSFYDIVS